MASISMLANAARSQDAGAAPDARVIRAVGHGATFRQAEEDALQRATRQGGTTTVRGRRETEVRSVDTGESYSFSDIYGENTVTEVHGQVIGHEISDTQRTAEGGWEITIEAAVRTPEALQRDFQNHIMKGMDQFRLERYPAAMASFEDALKVPNFHENRQARIWLYRATKSERNKTAYAALINAATAHLNAGRLGEARTAVNDIFKIGNDDEDYLIKKYGDDAAARELLRRVNAAEDGPARYEALVREGNRLLGEGRCAEAVQQFQLAMNENVRNKIDAEIGSRDANECLRRQIDNERQYQEWMRKGDEDLGRGKRPITMYDKRQVLENAITSYSTAMRFKPNDPVAQAKIREAEAAIHALPPPTPRQPPQPRPPCRRHKRPNCSDIKCIFG